MVPPQGFGALQSNAYVCARKDYGLDLEGSLNLRALAGSNPCMMNINRLASVGCQPIKWYPLRDSNPGHPD